LNVLLACGTTPPLEDLNPAVEPAHQRGAALPTTEPAARTEPAQIEWLLWHDIQGLFGGRALYLKSDGTALARIVERRPELRHRGALTPAQMKTLAQALHDADFLHTTVPDRMGIPDEARAVLVVRFASGEERRLEKWAGVRHGGFDAINSLMRTLTDHLAQTGSSERTDFDGEWQPEGPWPDLFAIEDD
jgi:hypothetical protein